MTTNRTALLALVWLCSFSLSAGAVTHEVDIVGLSFQPNDLTITVGDTVRWTNNGGSHDVRADNGDWASEIGFSTYQRTFNTVEEILYHCSVHSSPGRNIDQNMNGRITVVEAAAPDFMINAGLSDAWYYPPTGGQGFLIVVWEDIQSVFLAWFTYDVERPPEDVTAILGEPGHRWLTAQGPYEGDTATLTVNLSSGGIFDSSQPIVGPAEPVGTMTIVWTDCNEGLLSYDLPGLALTGEIPIQRIALDNLPLCEAAQTVAP